MTNQLIDLENLIEKISKSEDWIALNDAINKSRIYLSKDGSFNIFSFISNKYHREDFHSNILALILSPNNEPIGNVLNLKTFLEIIMGKVEADKYCNDKNYSIKIEREKKIKRGRVDILIIFSSKKNNEEKFVIVENKINGASFGDEQLSRYFASFDKSDLLKIVVIPNFSVDKNELCEEQNIKSLEDKEKLFILSSVSSDNKNSYSYFLEEIAKQISEGTNDDILRKKFIKDYIDIVKESYAKGPVMDKIKEIFNDKDKKQKFQELADKANDVLEEWNSRSNYIFKYLTDFKKFKNLKYVKSNIYGAPHICWKKINDKIGLYIQGEHKTYIQLGYYFTDKNKLKDEDKDFYEITLKDCINNKFGSNNEVYTSGSHWMFVNVHNETLDMQGSFDDICNKIVSLLDEISCITSNKLNKEIMN